MNEKDLAWEEEKQEMKTGVCLWSVVMERERFVSRKRERKRTNGRRRNKEERLLECNVSTM